MKTKTEFTSGLLRFLIHEGYTHIRCIGARNDDNEYLVEPLPPDDARIYYDDPNLHIEEIHEDDIKEMAFGIDLIQFTAILKNHVFEKYARQ